MHVQGPVVASLTRNLQCNVSENINGIKIQSENWISSKRQSGAIGTSKNTHIDAGFL